MSDRTLKDYFQNPDPPIEPYGRYNPPQVSPGIICNEFTPTPIPPPQRLFNLASYRTPFSFLWRRPRNVMEGL